MSLQLDQTNYSYYQEILYLSAAYKVIVNVLPARLTPYEYVFVVSKQCEF
jgi:hypothetical protein